jgi:N-acetylmuramoyl-L-alanine amidase
MMTVILDPAHGAPDPGARGASGVTEADVVLDFARAIRVSLESQGFRVLFTREGNQDPSFDERSALVNSLRDVVFVSLHVSSTGPIGTVRTYSYVYPAEAPTVSVPVAPSASESANQSAAQSAPAESAPAPAAPHAGLVQWDQAQRAYLSSSEQLASLVQIQLAQRFAGSPDVPLTAAVRQLRSIAAPAIAVEVSSVAVTDPQQLARMGQPLADAISRALIDFRAAGNASARSSGGVR